MYTATCNECGNKCEVPFRPTGDKPVLCNNCFGGGGKDGGDYEPMKRAATKEDFEELNKKLDKILRKLEAIKPTKEFIVEKPAKGSEPAEAEEETEEVKVNIVYVDEKEKAVKAPKKKAPAKKAKKAATKKKAPAKKTAAKKKK